MTSLHDIPPEIPPSMLSNSQLEKLMSKGSDSTKTSLPQAKEANPSATSRIQAGTEEAKINLPQAQGVNPSALNRTQLREEVFSAFKGNAKKVLNQIVQGENPNIDEGFSNILDDYSQQVKESS